MNQETRTRPKGLREVTLLMCALTVVPLLWFDDSLPGNPAAWVVLEAVFSGLWLLGLYFFWQGRNWARILVLVFSGLSIINLFTLAELITPHQVITVVDTLLSAFLLYWLNTRPVKEYFKPEQPVAPHDAHDSSVAPIPEP